MCAASVGMFTTVEGAFVVSFDTCMKIVFVSYTYPDTDKNYSFNRFQQVWLIYKQEAHL